MSDHVDELIEQCERAAAETAAGLPGDHGLVFVATMEDAGKGVVAGGTCLHGPVPQAIAMLGELQCATKRVIESLAKAANTTPARIALCVYREALRREGTGQHHGRMFELPGQGSGEVVL